MSVYVDELSAYPSGLWCHMYADTEDELHQFAESIGLKRTWAQHKPNFVIEWHYDLRPSKRALALQKGAISVKMLEYLKAKRDQVKADVCSGCGDSYPAGTLYAYGLSGMKVKKCQQCLVYGDLGDDEADD